MSSSYSPCAACKFLRRKCTQECVFAPYFPPDQPQKFANVHKVFGASNVSKLLNDLNPIQRQDAVNSLAYEAEARLHDPVYGCVGLISLLQKRLKHIQNEIFDAKKELASYIGPSAMLPMLHMVEPSAQAQAQDAQQLMQAEQEMMLSYWDQHQLQQQQMLFGYEAAAGGGAGGGAGSSSSGGASGSRFQGVNPFDLNGYHQIQMQQQQQQQELRLLLQHQQSTTVTAQPQQQKPEDEHKGPLLVLQQPDTVTPPKQQQQHERLLLSQQPATVAVQQHGLGEVPQGIPQQLQVTHHLLLEHNQNFESQENDNTAGPSC